MKKTIFPYLLLIFFGTQTVIAQLSTEVNLPSPEASSIAKYVNFPISYFTGTVDVSVPIYTIKQGGLNVPISLNYHGGGVKKDEHPGWVGMGWSLSANYQVTRQKSSGGNPDIFYYSTPHGSGKFYENMNRTVDDLDASIDYEAVTLQVYNKDTGCSSGSYCNYEYDGQLPEGMSQSDYGGIKITFADGTRYYFGRKIGTNGPVIVDTSEDFFGTGCSVKRHDTWHLVRIEAMDEDNFIDFEYELSPYNTCSFSPYFGFLENTYKTVSLQCAEQGAPPPYMLRQSYAGYSGRITKPYYLKKIHFNSGSLDFETSASTQLKYPFGDIYVQSEASTGCQYPNLGSMVWNQLDRIVLNSNNNYNVKSWNLTFTNSDYRRLRLLSLKEDDKPAYVFGYKGHTNPLDVNLSYNEDNPYIPPLRAYFDFRRDHWGYFSASNGVANLHSDFMNLTDFYGNHYGQSNSGCDGSVPEFNLQDMIDYKYEISTEGSDIGCLTKIKYPTGGMVEYVYESNTASHRLYRDQIDKKVKIEANGYYGGGVRVKEIKTTDSAGAIIQRQTINYDMGILSGLPDYFYVETFPYDASSAVWLIDVFKSEGVTEMSKNNTAVPITYSKVSVEDWNATNESNGKKVYYYSNYKDHNDVGALERINETILLDQNEQEFNDGFTSSIVLPFNGFAEDKGKLIGLYEYNRNGDTIQKQRMAYRPIDLMEEPFIYKIKYTFDIPKLNVHQAVFPYQMTERTVKYKRFSSNLVLTEKTTEQLFPGQSNVITKENYFYENDSMLPEAQEVTINNNLSYRTEYLYNKDVNAYNASKGLPIQTQKFLKKNNNKVLFEGEYNEYSGTSWSTTKPYKKYLFEGEKSNIYTSFHDHLPYSGLKVRATYDLFSDFGNILQVHVEDGNYTSYIWGYDNQYPIAKIENASYSQIASALGISIATLKTYKETNLTAINNLRSNTSLSNAMITTYTHIPLVGISTITDPKGDTITYTYDSFGRLQNVKDADGNILSENEYHYKNQ